LCLNNTFEKSELSTTFFAGHFFVVCEVVDILTRLVAGRLGSRGHIFDQGKGFTLLPKDQTVSGISQTSYLLLKGANFPGGKVAVE
jgi:hypothetical protein